MAVVVTHNRLDQLKCTVARLLESPQSHLAGLVVVDNASSDDTAAWLSGVADPRVDVVRSETNLGGAGGFEKGLRHAVHAFAPDWMVVMDDDARPEPGALAAFHAEPRGEREAWAGAVRYPDGRICDMNRPWINPFWHKRAFLRSLWSGRDGFHLSLQDYDRKGPCAVDGGSFVGLFLSRRAIERAGYPDGRLFIYGDDVLYTLSISAMGGRIAFDPRVRFEHDCGTLTEGVRVLRPLWKVYYFHRNQLMVYRMAAGPVLFWPVFLVKWLKWRARARHYGADRKAYLRLLAHAVRDGVRHRRNRRHAAVLRRVGSGTG